MTQFSTVAWDKTPSALPTAGVIVSIAIALTIGVARGFLASNTDTTSAAQETPQTLAITHEQFLRMNTEDLDHLAPAKSPAPVAVDASVADPFIVRNVDSYQWLEEVVESRQKVGSPSYEADTSGVGSVASDNAASAAPGSNTVGNSEPFGYPNYGWLETYLGTQRTCGVR